MGVMHSDEGGGDLQLMVETESQLSEASQSSMTKERSGMAPCCTHWAHPMKN